MNLSTVRPDVSEIQYHLFERSVHPELLNRHQGMTIRFKDYQASLHICDAGHTLCFQHRDKLITEVVAPIETLLPQEKRLIRHHVKGCRDHEYEFSFGVNYQNSCQVELVDAEVYHQIHEELLVDSQKVRMVCQFPSAHRFSLSPLSLIHTEAIENSFLVHTYHTYPENSSIVKTQTLFELV
ncbi:hypothetical protein Pla110_26800 [Polystyrenella longa]|uniref:DUF2617 domain-containing protein n=1 Tax=Polystyrenella longa TaxID=2528007 RepID=A0A518CP20_9PLAN|nr:DUF2617 family protein [Polystyrenella longa]QDU80944.1 hypothetical protein Pla110_26800 [Polystyrenella longa]